MSPRTSGKCSKQSMAAPKSTQAVPCPRFFANSGSNSRRGKLHVVYIDGGSHIVIVFRSRSGRSLVLVSRNDASYAAMPTSIQQDENKHRTRIQRAYCKHMRTNIKQSYNKHTTIIQQAYNKMRPNIEQGYNEHTASI